MSDPFALLGLPRRPWLDAAAVKAAFQERARHCHPDASGGDAEAFTTLNAAQALLANHASRLAFLADGAPLPLMPTNASLGFEIADLGRRTNKLAENIRTTTNPLARALLLQKIKPFQAELVQSDAALDKAGRALEQRLRELDAHWPGTSPADLAALAAEFTFLDRWRGQLRDASLSLRLAALPRST